jgi:hypothetical protein
MHISNSARIARLARATILLIAVGALVSCATQPVPSSPDPPGFLLGLFHGVTMFFSLIGSIFTDYRIYAFPNSGGWYDFGYVLGAASAFGGAGAGSR